MTKRIEIVAKPREKITLSLVGTEYLLTPPKGALGLTLAKNAKAAQETGDIETIWAEVLNWLSLAVGKKSAAAIQKRLDDAEDDLDIEHVMAVMEQVAEATTESPTSSSSD